MKHILTEQDLTSNPELETKGLKVGDEIDIPETDIADEQQSAPTQTESANEQEATEKSAPVLESKEEEKKEVATTKIETHEEVLARVNSVNKVGGEHEEKEKVAYPAHKPYDKFECVKGEKQITLLNHLGVLQLTEAEAAKDNSFLNKANPNPVYLFPKGEKKIGDVVKL